MTEQQLIPPVTFPILQLLRLQSYITRPIKMETNLSLCYLNDALFPISGKIMGSTFLLITEGVF